MAEQVKPKNEMTATVGMQCNFYRDQYRRAVLTTGAVLVMGVLCVLIIVYLSLHKPDDVYISAEDANLPASSPAITNFAIVPHIPLYSPNNMTSGEFSLWILQGIKCSFSYSLPTYKDQLDANKMYYTTQGWEEYMTVLTSLVNFSNLTTKQSLVSTMTPKAAPTVFEEKTVDGVYIWVIDFPIQVKFNGTVNVPWADFTLRLTIVRTPMDEDIYGVKIDGMKIVGIKRGNAMNAGFNAFTK